MEEKTITIKMKGPRPERRVLKRWKFWAFIAYADNPEDITRLWPKAHDIECEEVDEIIFTSRFPKPSWYTGENK